MHPNKYIPGEFNTFQSIKFFFEQKEVQEFFLSFNTTLCVGMGLIILLAMRNYNRMINEDTIDNIADSIMPYLPQKFIDALPNKEYDIEAQTT
jgi:hypothetical protein